jgi:hypothetical protein
MDASHPYRTKKSRERKDGSEGVAGTVILAGSGVKSA